MIIIQKNDSITSCLPGTKGRNKGEFTNLQGVAASSLGKVLIADSNNQCVQVKVTFSQPAQREAVERLGYASCTDGRMN